MSDKAKLRYLAARHPAQKTAHLDQRPRSGPPADDARKQRLPQRRETTARVNPRMAKAALPPNKSKWLCSIHLVTPGLQWSRDFRLCLPELAKERTRWFWNPALPQPGWFLHPAPRMSTMDVLARDRQR